ncbi:hypothetical protein [Rhizobium jaguaris]|uniref:hypothetical protein n=1 Tax=Rhizobium jaguaris TaxID=1312183 RepID=UPI0039BFB17F
MQPEFPDRLDSYSLTSDGLEQLFGSKIDPSAFRQADIERIDRAIGEAWQKHPIS